MAEHLSCAGDAGLDFVADHENVVLRAELADFLEVVFIWDDDTSFTLDGLDKERSDLFAVGFEGGFKRRDVVEWDWLLCGGAHGTNAGQVRTVVVSAFWVCGHGNGGEGAAVEVFLHAEDKCFVLRDLLRLVAPFPRDLDCGLHGLCAGVHGEHHIEAHHRSDLLGEAREDIVVEGATAESEAAGLLGKGLDELGVAVALVHGRVCREKIEVMFAFWVPDTAPGCSGENNGKGVVVVCGVGCFARHGGL